MKIFICKSLYDPLRESGVESISLIKNEKSCNLSTSSPENIKSNTPDKNDKITEKKENIYLSFIGKDIKDESSVSDLKKYFLSAEKFNKIKEIFDFPLNKITEIFDICRSFLKFTKFDYMEIDFNDYDFHFNKCGAVMILKIALTKNNDINITLNQQDSIYESYLFGDVTKAIFKTVMEQELNNVFINSDKKEDYNHRLVLAYNEENNNINQPNPEEIIQIIELFRNYKKSNKYINVFKEKYNWTIEDIIKKSTRFNDYLYFFQETDIDLYNVIIKNRNNFYKSNSSISIKVFTELLSFRWDANLYTMIVPLFIKNKKFQQYIEEEILHYANCRKEYFDVIFNYRLDDFIIYLYSLFCSYLTGSAITPSFIENTARLGDHTDFNAASKNNFIQIFRFLQRYFKPEIFLKFCLSFYDSIQKISSFQTENNIDIKKRNYRYMGISGKNHYHSKSEWQKERPEKYINLYCNDIIDAKKKVFKLPVLNKDIEKLYPKTFDINALDILNTEIVNCIDDKNFLRKIEVLEYIRPEHKKVISDKINKLP